MKLQLDFFINNANRTYASIINNPKQLCIEHSHDYYELVIVNGGSALHKVNGSVQPVAKGVVTFIRPADVHCYTRPSSGFEIINILISRQLVTDLFNFLGESFQPERLLEANLPASRSLSQNDLQMIVLQLEQLILSTHTLHIQSEALYRATLVNVVSSCFPVINVEHKIDMPDWFRQLCLDMMKYSNFKEGIPALRKMANKCPEHITRMFKKYLDKSPTEFINQIRLEYAAHSLISSAKKVIDICD
ncbi:MAG: AraC family ligand binding domain-containing protein, partial [FCB group bacterium]|nr:AraC family ligand binding domain-containing protein [FCB group bacterium]